MNNPFFRRLVAFVLLILLQSFVLSRLPLGTYVQPCIYIFFILQLPFGYSRVAALLWAFALGFFVDLLSSDMIGIHIACTLVVAYVRPYVLKLFSPKMDFDTYLVPSFRTLGWRFGISYLLLMVGWHQSLFFFLDVFGFYDFWHTIVRIVLSTLCSVVFILVLQAVLPDNRKSFA
jgi:rod shape-determining protein MreD